jgi:hypothetical protein
MQADNAVTDAIVYALCLNSGTRKGTNNDKKMADRLYPLYTAEVDGSRVATPSEIENAKKWVTQYQAKYGKYRTVA